MEMVETQENVTETGSPDSSQPQVEETGLVDQVSDNESFDWNDFGSKWQLNTKDKRYGTLWKTPKDLENSYKSLESELSKKGQTLKQLEAQLAESSQTKSEYENVRNFVQQLESNPNFGPKLAQLLEDYQKEQTLNKYGVELPPEIIKKIDLANEYIEKQQREEEVNKLSSEFKSCFSELDKMAEEYGIEYDKKEFADYCYKLHGDDITSDKMMNAFYKKAFPIIKNNISQKSQDNVMKNLEKNKMMVSLPSKQNNQSQSSNGDLSLRDQLLRAIKK